MLKLSDYFNYKQNTDHYQWAVYQVQKVNLVNPRHAYKEGRKWMITSLVLADLMDHMKNRTSLDMNVYRVNREPVSLEVSKKERVAYFIIWLVLGLLVALMTTLFISLFS